MPKRKQKVSDVTEDDDGLSLQERFFRMSAMNIEKIYGKEVVSSAVEEDANLDFLDVDDLSMQYALGRQGYALGKVLYVVGYEGSGKTSFALWVANMAMQKGGFAAMVETEQAGSSEHMRSYLKNPELFRVFHPATIEDAMKMSSQVLDIFAELDPTGKAPKVLIMDSIAGSTDERTESDEDTISTPKVGGTAKIIKDYANIIKNKLVATNTLWVVLNQGRDYIDTSGGFAGRLPDIDKVVATGGRALPFVASYYAILKKQAAVKDSDGDKSGFKVKLTYKKNKLREPFREVLYRVKFGESFDFVDETLQFLSNGDVCGLKKLKGNVYICPEVGVGPDAPLKPKAMYELIHSPEHMPKFQEELDILIEGGEPAGQRACATTDIQEDSDHEDGE